MPCDPAADARQWRHTMRQSAASLRPPHSGGQLVGQVTSRPNPALSPTWRVAVGHAHRIVLPNRPVFAIYHSPPGIARPVQLDPSVLELLPGGHCRPGATIQRRQGLRGRKQGDAREECLLGNVR